MGLTNLIPGFSAAKIGLVVGGLVFIGLTVFFVNLHIEKQDEQIDALINQVAVLKIANQAFDKAFAVKIEEMKGVRAELKFSNERDANARKEVASLKEELLGRDRAEQQARILRGGKASLLLRVTNSSARCEWAHILDFDGKCRGGIWKKDE